MSRRNKPVGIMVDELVVQPNAVGIFRAGSSHLTTDGDLEELHAFAARIGLRRSWFQEHATAPHYDLIRSRRDRALALGATFVPAREQARRRLARKLGVPREGRRPWESI